MINQTMLSDGDRRYVNMLKRVILGSHNPEIGARITYLLECLGESPSPHAVERTFDGEYFARLGDHEAEVWQGILHDNSRYGMERLLGFPHSMLGPDRLDDVERAILAVDHDGIAGDFLETGVWRGGVGIFAKSLYELLGDTDRTVWMADSFRGLPEPDLEYDDPDDLDTNWALAASLDTVKRNFEFYDLLDERVQFIEGWFADTMPTAPIKRLSVLRLDGDYYSSTMDVLVAMYPKLSDGGFVLVDDYGAYDACRKAVHDYLVHIGEEPVITISDWTGAWWRKGVNVD